MYINKETKSGKEEGAQKSERKKYTKDRGKIDINNIKYLDEIQEVQKKKRR